MLQPNADCDLDELLEMVEKDLQCNMGNTTVVMTVPFGLSGSDHYTIRSQLLSLPQLRDCKAVYFVESAPCVLLAHGLVTGIVCSIGFGQTFVAPVVDGRVVREGVIVSRLGGMALTQRMQHLVFDEAEDMDWNHLQSLLDLPLVTYCRNLKEQYCYALPQPPSHYNGPIEPPVNIPITAGGQAVMQLTLQYALYQCPELLFEGDAGLGQMIYAAVQAASEGQPNEHELRAELLSSIVLNGGSSQIRGLGDRIRYEVSKQLPEECSAADVRVVGGDCGDKTPWRGAVRLALATPNIYSSNTLPQSLLLHQCSAEGCSRTQALDGTPLKVRRLLDITFVIYN